MSRPGRPRLASRQPNNKEKTDSPLRSGRPCPAACRRPGRLGAPPPSSILANARYREALTHGWTIPLAALAIAGFAASASAQGKISAGAKLFYDNLHDDLQLSVCELSVVMLSDRHAGAIHPKRRDCRRQRHCESVMPLELHKPATTVSNNLRTRLAVAIKHWPNIYANRDEARRMAVNIAKLPSVPRQILKDIPRPPNSASYDWVLHVGAHGHRNRRRRVPAAKKRGRPYGSLNLKVVIVSLNASSNCRVVAKVRL